MNQKLETSLSILLTLAAVVMAGTFAFKVFADPSATPQRQPKAVTNWDELTSGGIRLGPAGAGVQIVEFIDFECPFCKTSYVDLDQIRTDFPTQVAVRYYHFPLSRVHRFAEVSAHAAECAREQDRFSSMARLMFAMQDSFGLKAWTSFAHEAQVPDTIAFGTCMASRRHESTIAEHRQLAQRMSLEGTPTLIIDGWQLPFAPPADTIRTYVGALLRGEELPFVR